ncbi:MAG: hypothetical protein JJ900_03570 [Rhodospirillales bacterium]|nr:hypothetical protein [Rhodospirillales bacterium]MBO6785904.1 hypothetical protein [Rhodospirillales bacterium]
MMSKIIGRRTSDERATLAGRRILQAATLCAGVVLSLLAAGPAQAECWIENGKIKCNGGDGGGDGGGTLIVVEGELFKQPGALRERMERGKTLESVSPMTLEGYRSSLEDVNRQIEADRQAIEMMRQENQITFHEYQGKMSKYHSAIENYRDGIALYREKMR